MGDWLVVNLSAAPAASSTATMSDRPLLVVSLSQQAAEASKSKSKQFLLPVTGDKLDKLGHKYLPFLVWLNSDLQVCCCLWSGA